MDALTTSPSAGPLRGSLRVPGDKSVSHRAVMFAALAEGTSHIENFAPGADNRSTIAVFRALGADIHLDEPAARVTVVSPGAAALRSPSEPLDCGNSGTTMRLTAGILVGLGLGATLVGDDSLQGRPMNRVAQPLARLGGLIQATGPGGRPPLVVTPGSRLTSDQIDLPIASAQVKSALLLAAALQGQALVVTEPQPSRDHTELMLRALGFTVSASPHYQHPDEDLPGTPRVTLWFTDHLATPPSFRPSHYLVPGDISSAAFLLVAAALVPGSEVLLQACGVSPTRAGVLRVFERARIPLPRLHAHTAPGGEPVADLLARALPPDAQPFTIEAREVPTLVDEVPILAVLACLLPGPSVMHGLAELRVKESDRLARTALLVETLGRRAHINGDTLTVEGDPHAPIPPFTFDAHLDHRMAAAALVAALRAQGPCTLTGHDSLAVSYPALPRHLKELGG
jgi:3-phosphoshikimate 1-carboxyvinyltransferase